MNFDLAFTKLTNIDREIIRSHSLVEERFAPAKDFFRNPRNIFFRSHAVSVIAILSKRINPDTLIPYLAMNYFDRFFSMNPRILEDVEGLTDTEIVRLIAVACLTISAKMRIKDFSIELFLNSNHTGLNVRISYHMVMSTELFILSELNWEMLSVTSFTLLNYIHRYFTKYGPGFKRRCINEIIVQAQGEHTFVHYVPTVMTIAAFLAASKIAYSPSQYKEVEAMFNIPRVCAIEKVQECMKEVLDLCNRLNIQIETQVSGVHSTSKIEEIQQNKDKAAMEVDSSEEDDDAEEGTSLIKQCRDKVKTMNTSQVQVAEDTTSVNQATEIDHEENKMLAKGKGKAVDTTETFDGDYKARFEAIIRQRLEKGKPSVSEKLEGLHLEIAELEELKSLMIFELKWPTDVPSTEPERPSEPEPEPEPVKPPTRKKFTCGGCNIG